MYRFSKKNGCIIVIPSSNAEILDLLVDEYIPLNNLRCLPSDLAKKVIVNNQIR